jgi:hypothetical protein
MSDVLVGCSLESIEERIAPLREKLAVHPLYERIKTVRDVQVFMASHVFAVWDFMTLLKALQRVLTCVEVPWVPSAFPVSRRFVNEIVLGEESDEYHGRPVSHFEVYLEAMEQVGADTRAIRGVIGDAVLGIDGFAYAGVPEEARAFVESTFRVVRRLRSEEKMRSRICFGRW